MGLGDSNIFIFNYSYYTNMYRLFWNYFCTDYTTIKNYYYNIFSWNNWKPDKHLLLFLPLFYLVLMLGNIFHYFLIFKIVFYILKYLLKYLFLLIDFFFFFFFYKLNIQNKYILTFFKLIYILTIKLLYIFYKFIFYVLPGLIHTNSLCSMSKDTQFFLIAKIHKILDFLEWLPYSPPFIFISFINKKLTKFFKLLLNIFEVRTQIWEILRDRFIYLVKSTIFLTKFNWQKTLPFTILLIKFLHRNVSPFINDLLIHYLYSFYTLDFLRFSFLFFRTLIKKIIYFFYYNFIIFFYIFKNSNIFFFFCSILKYFINIF